MEFSDYLQIQNLLHRYAHLMDQADFEGVGQLFAHADVYFPGDAGVYRKDPAGLANLYRRWTRVYSDTGTLRTRHITTNLILEEDGRDRAKARCYVLVVQQTPAFPLQPASPSTPFWTQTSLSGCRSLHKKSASESAADSIKGQILSNFTNIPLPSRTARGGRHAGGSPLLQQRGATLQRCGKGIQRRSCA